MNNENIKITLQSLLTAEATQSLQGPGLNADESLSEVTYHELSHQPVQSIDLFEQLDKNLMQLSDLQNRLKFVMSEVRYQLKI